MDHVAPASQRATPRRLDQAAFDAVDLEYDVRGAGEPVVLIHAGVCADFFAPLLEEPALGDRYRLVRYHRAGYAGSGRCGHLLRPGAARLARTCWLTRT